VNAERGVIEILHEAQVRIPHVRARQVALVAAMDAQSTTRRMKVASQPGWLGRQFVMPHKVYGGDQGRVLRRFPNDAPGAGLRPEGELADWQADVAAMARGNHSSRPSWSSCS
jgi:hypothetical protein